LLVAGCKKGGGGGPQKQPPTLVDIRPAGTEPLDETLAAVGTIEPNEIVELKTEAPGRITAIPFAEGSRVAQGAVLFRLDSAKEEAQLAQARAEEEVARQNLERAQKLAGTKAISQQELDQMSSQVAARSASRQLQQERVNDLTISAPFAGTVGPRRVSVGQYVDSGQSLVTLVDDTRVKISYRVPERNLARYKIGQAVHLVVSAYPGRKFEGIIDLINPVIDEASRTAQIRAVAPNADSVLRPGMFARVETVVARRSAAVVIPETAIVPGLDTFNVYLVRDGMARLTPVKLGVRGPGTVEIAEGVAPGQPVVIQGTQKLVDGALVVAAAPATNAPTKAAAPVAGPAAAGPASQ
jgi:membrane fusion protein (multidrug efflux system)